MSLKILLDENLQGKLLVKKLSAAGHDVQTVLDAGLLEEPDDAIFAHACSTSRVVITRNCNDFKRLANACTDRGEHHPGVVLIYFDQDREKDMSNSDIIRALSNLEQTDLELRDQVISLANYRY